MLPTRRTPEKQDWSLRNEKDNIFWTTGSYRNGFDGMYARPTLTPTTIIRPSPRKRWRRYDLVEFDVPGQAKVKRYRADITLDFAGKHHWEVPRL
jgi:hypothetical protein